jgi:hypothetical protein
MQCAITMALVRLLRRLLLLLFCTCPGAIIDAWFERTPRSCGGRACTGSRNSCPSACEWAQRRVATRGWSVVVLRAPHTRRACSPSSATATSSCDNELRHWV